MLGLTQGWGFPYGELIFVQLIETTDEVNVENFRVL